MAVPQIFIVVIKVLKVVWGPSCLLLENWRESWSLRIMENSFILLMTGPRCIIPNDLFIVDQYPRLFLRGRVILMISVIPWPCLQWLRHDMLFLSPRRENFTFIFLLTNYFLIYIFSTRTHNLRLVLSFLQDKFEIESKAGINQREAEVIEVVHGLDQGLSTFSVCCSGKNRTSGRR